MKPGPAICSPKPGTLAAWHADIISSRIAAVDQWALSQHAAPGPDNCYKKANGNKGHCVFQVSFQHGPNLLVCLMEVDYVLFLFFCQMENYNLDKAATIYMVGLRKGACHGLKHAKPDLSGRNEGPRMA
jgi:hypothetical protein